MAASLHVAAPRPCDGVAAALQNAFADDYGLPHDMAALLAKLDDQNPRSIG